jgi:hypothetical protein
MARTELEDGVGVRFSVLRKQLDSLTGENRLYYGGINLPRSDRSLSPAPGGEIPPDGKIFAQAAPCPRIILKTVRTRAPAWRSVMRRGIGKASEEAR